MLPLLLSLFFAGPLFKPRHTTKVFFDIEIDGKKAGRIIIGLDGNVLPRTVDNFLHLCLCEKGKGKSGKDLCYKGTPIHRIVPGFVFQAGDTTNASPFADETFAIRQDEPGIVAMANDGPNTNGSQFYITLARTDSVERLQSTNVAFGSVINALSNGSKPPEVRVL